MKKNIIIIAISIIVLTTIVYMIVATQSLSKYPGTAIPSDNLVQDGVAGER